MLPLMGLVLLGLRVTSDPVAPAWDVTVLLALHQYATPRLDRGIAIATHLGTTWGVLPASIVFVGFSIWHHRWRSAAYLTTVMLGSTVINPLAKLIGHRARPDLWLGVPFHADFSFPSGHATYSMAFVAALIVLHWRAPQRVGLIVGGTLLTLLVGCTRLYLGVHYPSDIVGGWLLAIAWVMGLKQVIGSRGEIP